MHAKLFAAGMAVLVGCAVPTLLQGVREAAIEHAQQQDAARSANQLTLAHELPGTPPDVVATLVYLLADDSSVTRTEGCLLFTRQAAQQFADVSHQPTCIAAMRQLQGEVSNPDTYADDLIVPATAWTQADNTATVNGCDATWSDLFTEARLPPPGPRPGLMILHRLDDYGWQVVSYQPC